MTSLGNAGLTGRAQVRPVDLYDIEDPENLTPGVERVTLAMPSMCRHKLSMPPSRSECQPDCSGRQRDGGCLCDVVTAAEAAGEECHFEIDPDGFWIRVR